MDEDGKVSVNTVSTVAYISFKYGTILLLPPDNAWTELSDVHSLQHVTSGTAKVSMPPQCPPVPFSVGKLVHLQHLDSGRQDRVLVLDAEGSTG
ncbi:hypothetical protein KUCAC02_009943 [Chaenocephalus aceratus]|uniref:Uncharacterized protein n=1 Tax=Chaenocephalus aceratus TaxID=36190 RepID=A0ACB9VXJ7_CHAAC|nr:hypothetical protein KUCAC02_009943 [Chaenocephalus aceratus]